MNPPAASPFDEDQARLLDEASALMARARIGPNVFVQREIDAWVSRSETHARLWALLQRLEQATAAHPHAALERRSVGRRRRWLAVAGVAVLVVVAGLWGPTLLSLLDGDLRTGTGEVATLTLFDGSKVSLDAGGVLAPTTAEDERGARLLQGQAYFDVVPDPGRPFRVQAGAMTVTVLGTGFSVGAHPDGVEVALEHGSVEVRTGSRSQRLQPGQRLRVGIDGQVRVDAVPVVAIGAWRHGQLVLDDVPLQTMVDALQPHFRGRIVLRDDVLGGQHITGVFDLADPQRALQAAVAPLGGSIRTLSPWLLLVEDAAPTAD
jgi:transmembrane sensor